MEIAIKYVNKVHKNWCFKKIISYKWYHVFEHGRHLHLFSSAFISVSNAMCFSVKYFPLFCLCMISKHFIEVMKIFLKNLFTYLKGMVTQRERWREAEREIFCSLVYVHIAEMAETGPVLNLGPGLILSFRGHSAWTIFHYLPWHFRRKWNWSEAVITGADSSMGWWHCRQGLPYSTTPLVP